MDSGVKSYSAKKQIYVNYYEIVNFLLSILLQKDKCDKMLNSVLFFKNEKLYV